MGFASLAIAVSFVTQEPDARAAASRARVEVRVDRRVELLSIVARLARFHEYRPPNAQSPYAQEVDEHFGLWADHPVIASLQRLREERGVGFDAVTGIAVHLTDDDRLDERVPFDRPPERLDGRWRADEARAFLEELRDFALTTDAFGFFEAHAELYRRTEERMREVIARSEALAWFDRFFGVRAGARYVAIPGLLCGGANYGLGVRFADGRPEEILPVFGCSRFDPDGVPVFDDGLLSLFIHELCHSYSNPIVDRFAAEFEPAAARIFPRVAVVMSRQAYGTWRTMMYESFVRACTVRCRAATEGAAAGRAQAAEESARGFTWVPELAERLATYEGDRTRWPAFGDFVPEIVAFFEEVARRLEEQAEREPKIVEMAPANGATDVDPALTTLTLRFDRPMAAGWSFVGDRKDLPETRGSPAYDESGCVLTMTIRLEAGRTYHYYLNGPGSEGFASREGVPLVPVEVRFTTRAGE